MSNTNLQPIFSPKSIAVIGASAREDSVGRALFTNVLFSGYTGIVYPVNPNARGILGVRAYHSVWDIPEEVELAVIIVPSTAVPIVMEECGEKGVKAAIIISAGFKEIGNQGIEIEEAIKSIAQKHSIRLVGPNCLGVINTDPNICFNATFAGSMPKPGNISFISQSGALGVAALEYVRGENIGISKFVSMGNKADINENDLLEVLKNDPLTDVILLYLEDLTAPKHFIELTREIAGVKKKPILAIKSGRTIEGARAASSHTGALASSDEAYDSFFKQCGVLRVETLEELFEYAIAFAKQPLPYSNKIAIVTNAGGPGIMATDTGIRYGLQLSQFESATTNRLQDSMKSHLLPQTANITNPIDVIGDANADRYATALQAVLEDKNVAGAIVICTPRSAAALQPITQVIAEIVPRYKKPVMACCMGVTDISSALKILDEKNIPHYRFPEAAARALANMAEYAHWLTRPQTEIKVFTDVDKDKVANILAAAKIEDKHFLTEPDCYEILNAYGFPILGFRLAKTETDAIQAANQIGYPIVMKIVSPDILHKLDVKGVQLNIDNDKEAKNAYNNILQNVNKIKPKANILGILVQKMAQKGKETIIGMNRDPHFGPLIMFGLGGSYVEILKDVSFRIAPIRELSAQYMIEEIRGYKILQGYRGEKPSDIKAIVECLERLSQLVSDFQEIKELDINPLSVLETGKGAQVLDARILI
ncbi:MAG: acetate--CoA ligase family protein [Candidatus Stahlbacteria bacterium]|nr:acetate--CoA ligase family protein [Candidatus Stahlbacteria bacterium]